MQVQSLNLYVCKRTCLDELQQNGLRTILLPPDPIAVDLPFPETYAVNVPSFISTETRNTITAENTNPLINEIADTPTPDPNNPVLYPDE